MGIAVDYLEVLEEGTDSYGTHFAIYGDRVKRENVEIVGKIVGAGAILVDLHKSFRLEPVEVKMYGKDGELLTEGKITPDDIADDSFAWTRFPKRIEGKEGVNIEFSSLKAKVDNAVGIRFDKGSGALSLELIKRISLGETTCLDTE